MTNIQKFFQDNGYYHARSVFSAEELTLMGVDFDRILAQLRARPEESDGTWPGPAIDKLRAADDRVLHTHNVQHYSAVWLRVIAQSAFLDIVQEILGEHIVLHHTKLFFKPRGTGSPFPIHQDYSYFPTDQDTMIAGVIHVSDATDNMGCLRVYPQSHQLGRLPASSGRENSDLSDRYPLLQATPVEAKAGDVVFFHYLTLHGSLPNRSDQDRKTVLVQMHSGQDCVEAGNDHPNARLTLRGWNFHASREMANQ